MLQRIKEYLLSLERKNILALFLVILFLLSVIGATSYTRFQWDDKKYADISKTSELVKQLLSEHPDAKYTVEEAEFYQEMYPFYRSYKHLWDPTKGERWVVLWWTEETVTS